MNKPRYISQIFRLFGASIALLIAALACNMPVRERAQQAAAMDITDRVSESGNFLLRPVEVERGRVTIAVDLTAGQTEAGLYTTWMYLFDTALTSAPGAEQVTIELYTLGEPYATLTAQAGDIRDALDEHINAETFFSRVQMEDQRPPEAGLRQALASRGWVVSRVEITAQQATVEGFQPFTENREELVSEWFEAMAEAYRYAPDSQEITLRLHLTGAPPVIVRASREHVRAYLAGEIEAGTFLAGLVLEE